MNIGYSINGINQTQLNRIQSVLGENLIAKSDIIQSLQNGEIVAGIDSLLNIGFPKSSDHWVLAALLERSASKVSPEMWKYNEIPTVGSTTFGFICNTSDLKTRKKLSHYNDQTTMQCSNVERQLMKELKIDQAYCYIDRVFRYHLIYALPDGHKKYHLVQNTFLGFAEQLKKNHDL